MVSSQRRGHQTCKGIKKPTSFPGEAPPLLGPFPFKGCRAQEESNQNANVMPFLATQ